jgi:hypothetical protein
MRRLSLALGFAFLTGCSFLVDLTGLGGGSDASNNGDGGNLLTNGGFEQSLGACGPGWISSNAAATAVDASHSGGLACQLCMTAPGKATYLTASPTIKNPPVGTTYYAQAYMMIEPDAALTKAYLFVEENRSVSSWGLGTASADLTSTSWQNLQLSSTAFTDAGISVQYNIVLESTDAGGGCVIVDDARMIAQ